MLLSHSQVQNPVREATSEANEPGERHDMFHRQFLSVLKSLVSTLAKI